jgi:transposase InsO family protein
MRAWFQWFAPRDAYASDDSKTAQIFSLGAALKRVVVEEDNATAYTRSIQRLLTLIAQREITDQALAPQFQQTFLALVKSTAWQESCWRQFIRVNGRVRFLKSDTADVGMMQVNQHIWRGFYSIPRLEWDIAYNAGAGAEILMRLMLSFVGRRFHSRAVLELENLALRHQLHVLNRQKPGRPRLFTIDRLLWVWLYRLWPRCLEVMVLVKPATIVQWHRQGFRLYWRWRSRSGRPSVNREIRDLIRQMNVANPLWGAPRIHGELLKLGIEISQATVAKYMVRRRSRPSPTWRSFLRNQAAGIAAIDMFVMATVSFRLLYVMIILAHDRRRIVRFDVTRYPTANWLARQVTDAFPWDCAPRYLLRDRDASYGESFRKQVDAMGITEVITAPRSPWQNAYVERVIGSIRRECLDHIVIFNERHLRRVLSSWVDYYHRTRTHLSLDKDSPDPRPVLPPRSGTVVAVPQVSGLHHRYERLAA